MLRLRYYRRILPAYVLGRRSQLSFWHDAPEVNEEAHPGTLGQYWMPFTEKADYGGPYDADGIPQLDYRGATGVQYNPIAVAQYGLGNYNLYRRAGDPERLRKFLLVADWLAASLEQNAAGLWVWGHNFDWEYRTLLKAPWRSGLAQGQGVSVLVRAFKETENERYRDAAGLAMASFYAPMHEGGVAFVDEVGSTWIEEYIVSPPTHVLNGFIWASWGVYDYWLLTGDADAKDLFETAMDTIAENLPRYDTGYWSLYEQVRRQAEDAGEPLLPPPAHCAASSASPADGAEGFPGVCRPMGDVYPQPRQAVAGPGPKGGLQAPLLLAANGLAVSASAASAAVKRWYNRCRVGRDRPNPQAPRRKRCLLQARPT